MDLTVFPSQIDGIVTANPSKSHMLRAIAASLLSEGKNIIGHPSFCNDSKAAMNVAADLGAGVKIEKQKVIITGVFDPAGYTLNCGESGLGLRMFSAIASLSDKEITLTGQGTLRSRSVSMIEKPLKELGVKVTSNKGKLPVRVRGPLTGGKAIVDGSLSSQFLTGLLMALPLAEKDSELVVNDLKSKFYIDLTLKVMRDFGIEVRNDNYEHFFIKGGQSYRSREYDIEGDWSGSAFLCVAGAVGGKVEIKNLNIDSCQADRRIIDVLKQVNATVDCVDDKIKVSRAGMNPFNFDATDSPDLFPPLAALAPYLKGQSKIKGVNRLIGKESNRAEALLEEFMKVGIKIDIDNENMIINGGTIKGGTMNSRNDHRMAMAAAIAGIGAEESITIEDYECIEKSYPDFFKHYEKIGGRINE